MRTRTEPAMPSMGVIDDLASGTGTAVDRYRFWLLLNTSYEGPHVCATLVLRECLPDPTELHFVAVGAKL